LIFEFDAIVVPIIVEMHVVEPKNGTQNFESKWCTLGLILLQNVQKQWCNRKRPTQRRYLFKELKDELKK